MTLRYRAWRWVIDTPVLEEDVIDAAREAFEADFDWVLDRVGRIAVPGLCEALPWTLRILTGAEKTFITVSWFGDHAISGSGYGSEAAHFGASLKGLGATRMIVDDDDIDIP